MSSALAMVLMAAMTVPGSGPEKVSSDVDERLNLGGQWTVTYHCVSGQTDEWVAIVEGGHFKLRSKDKTLTINFGEVQDEGRGNIRWTGGPRELLGIYRRYGDRVIISFREASTGRPKYFNTEKDQDIIILDRGKPAK
jgi:hypothetical protein